MVRERSAKPLCVGSIPTRASIKSPIKMRLLRGIQSVVPRLCQHSIRASCKSFPFEGLLPRFDPRAAVLLRDLYARVADQGERTAEEVWCPSAILAVLNTSPDESVGSSSYLAFVRICSII